MTNRINCVDDFELFEEKAKTRLARLESTIQVKVHLGSCGIASGANKVMEAFLFEVDNRKLSNIVVEKAACIGLCYIEPVVSLVFPDNQLFIYHDVHEENVKEIIEGHILNGNPVSSLLFDNNSARIKLQENRVLHNQSVDATDIEIYVATGGYKALAQVFKQNRDDSLGIIEKSGLRGRGGAGFPVSRKWSMLKNAPGEDKFIVCNGDEGDPGAYMNRAVLEGNPHSIIEGMIIGAYIINNVKQGYAYIRAEYPLAIDTIERAIAQAEEMGLLGDNIMGTGFNFHLDIFPGAGAYVCGEETALLASIEGKRGTPHQRPPFPTNPGGGLFGKPTIINNVETWSNIPQIILKGADWFASVGSDKCKGTKTLCLVGKVNNPGLIEVPLGISIEKVVFDIGGGIPEGKKFKAVQMGGPSGGVIPVEHINSPIDYDEVPKLGAIMGSGGVVVMDENSCMVDVAKFFLEFSKDESCGKCTSCRAGIPQMLAILNKISRGQASLPDLDILAELAETIQSTALCGLGQTSANPVLSTLRHFRDEYEAHVIDKKCPASFCRGLFKAPCQHTCPVELDIPGYVSLIKDGKYAEAYSLIKQRNPLPSVCGRVCTHPCELKCNRSQIDQPVAIRELKRFASDWAFSTGYSYSPKIKTKRKEKVAIIGSGPAGLSAAWDLSFEGFKVTIFEALPIAGGMLAIGIPEYRLPRDILNKEIEDIKSIGVEIKLNSRIDDLNELVKQGFDAVFVGSGAHIGLKMEIPGINLNGVYDAIQFLRDVNLGKKVNIGKKVAVVGGGNSAIDSARIALRMGAKEVHLIYRRNIWDMPAQEEEILAAENEGIVFHLLTNPVRIAGEASVTGLELIKMAHGSVDKSGRKSTHPIIGTEYILDFDTVIMAIGQKPDISFVSGLKISQNGSIYADPRTLFTGFDRVFAGGDAVDKPKTVIEAIAHGQRAASSIRRLLDGKELEPLVERNGYEPIIYSKIPPTEEELKRKERLPVPELSIKSRISSFEEVVHVFSEQSARAEAARCMRCDLD